MNFYIVWKKTSFDNINTTGYQCDMFHGCETENKIRIANYTYGDILEEKIHVDVNLYKMGEIIEPGRNLVVSEKVKNILATEDNIAFLKVIFDKTINIPYQTGMLPDNYENLFPHEPYSFTDIYKHDPSLTIGNYYELIAPEIYLIYRNYHDRTDYKLQYRNTSITFLLELSESMLNENPVLWTSRGIIFSPSVFEKIEPYFNWDYFEKKEYDIKFQSLFA